MLAAEDLSTGAAVSIALIGVLGVAVGALIAGFVAFRVGTAATNQATTASSQLDEWRRREETMRLLRFAAEQAGSGEDARREIAVALLDGLVDGVGLLQPQDRQLVTSIASTILRLPNPER
jgi:type II secretory pathway pseudopilin PulG